MVTNSIYSQTLTFLILGATMRFSVALTSQHLLSCIVTSGWRMAGTCLSMRWASRFLSWGLRLALPSEDMVSAMCPVGGAQYTRGALLMPVSDILVQSKPITSPDRGMKSLPTRPGALIWSEHTTNVCLNSHPFIMRVRDCCPLMSRTSPVTPYGSTVVTFVITRCAWLPYWYIGATDQNQASRRTLCLHRYSRRVMLQ